MSDAASLDSIATASLDSHFDQLADRFASARVHAFVPILVERSVRSRLEQPAR